MQHKMNENFHSFDSSLGEVNDFLDFNKTRQNRATPGERLLLKRLVSPHKWAAQKIQQ